MSLFGWHHRAFRNCEQLTLNAQVEMAAICHENVLVNTTAFGLEILFLLLLPQLAPNHQVLSRDSQIRRGK
jgi:hypothetical protein